VSRSSRMPSESVEAEHLGPSGRDVKCCVARNAKFAAVEAMRKARVGFPFDPSRQ
jgi:hypothetical protein